MMSLFITSITRMALDATRFAAAAVDCYAD